MFKIIIGFYFLGLTTAHAESNFRLLGSPIVVEATISTSIEDCLKSKRGELIEVTGNRLPLQIGDAPSFSTVLEIEGIFIEFEGYLFGYRLRYARSSFDEREKVEKLFPNACEKIPKTYTIQYLTIQDKK